MWHSAAVPLSLLLAVAGCASLGRTAATPFAEDLQEVLLNQTDPEIVRDGAPAYLLAVDGLIEGAPNDTEFLLAGSRMYGAYASAFVADPVRERRLAQRSFDYARRALCVELAEVCAAVDRPFDEFVATLAPVGTRDVQVLYAFGSAWAGWIQSRGDDWGAIAEVPKVEALMGRVLELDESYEDGAPHLYLGVLFTQRPASLGGQPEAGRQHFERAVALSKGRNLMAKVLYARYYARLVFDRPLHDRLLDEVVSADPAAPGLTLSNTLAQDEARQLLADADDYF
jgi:hypothetical protein